MSYCTEKSTSTSYISKHARGNSSFSCTVELLGTVELLRTVALQGTVELCTVELLRTVELLGTVRRATVVEVYACREQHQHVGDDRRFQVVGTIGHVICSTVSARYLYMESKLRDTAADPKCTRARDHPSNKQACLAAGLSLMINPVYSTL